jgi:hypothetical protein
MKVAEIQRNCTSETAIGSIREKVGQKTIPDSMDKPL